MDIQEVFATNVRYFRLAKGYTQEDLAERSDLHRTYIGSIEQQATNPRLENVQKIARALGVEPAVLFMSNGDTEARRAHKGSPEGTRDASPELGQGQIALLLQTDEGLAMLPLDQVDPAFSLHIATALRDRGLSGNDLATAFRQAEKRIEYFLGEF